MKTLSIATALVLVVLFAISAFESNSADAPYTVAVNEQRSDTDQVVESFEREMNRQPVPANPANREAIEKDVLYQALNEIHWTRDSAAVAEPPEK